MMVNGLPEDIGEVVKMKPAGQTRERRQGYIGRWTHMTPFEETVDVYNLP